MNKFYLLVKDDVAFSAINYVPEIPDDIELYEITLEDFKNFSDNGYKFNPQTKKLEPKSVEELIERAWIELRGKRDSLLSQSDWTTVSDNPLSEEKKNQWKLYRQQLRDFPGNVEDPRNPDWPVPPS